jgi:hypothetical protein
MGRGGAVVFGTGFTFVLQLQESIYLRENLTEAIFLHFQKARLEQTAVGDLSLHIFLSLTPVIPTWRPSNFRSTKDVI